MTPYPSTFLHGLAALCYGTALLLGWGGVFAGVTLVAHQAVHLRLPISGFGLTIASLVIVVVLSAPAWAPRHSRGGRS